MKLIQTIVSNAGFRDPKSNPQRSALLRRLLEAVSAERPDLVMLPGGYWSVRTENDARPVIEDVERIATEFGVTIAAGVDVASRNGNAKRPGKGGTKSIELPYYGFVAGPVTFEAGQDGPWLQTSSTSANAADVADEDVPGRCRIALVASKRVGVLICGELFSRWARESMAGLAPNLVLDLGHESMGTGVTRAMENIARAGHCAVAHTQHVVPWGTASLHFVDAAGVRHSVAVSDCEWVGDNHFWIAWNGRTI